MLLELVSKPPEADGDAGEVEEALVDEAVMLVPHDQPPEELQPADGAFDLPASAVPSQLASILSLRPLADGDRWGLLPDLHLRRRRPVADGEQQRRDRAADGAHEHLRHAGTARRALGRDRHDCRFHERLPVR